VGLGRDHTIYALVPGFVKFWWHGIKRKNYVEVVLSPTPPGEGKGSGVAQPVVPAASKYPIVRARPWELPSLLKLPADTRISDAVRGQIIGYVRSLNHFQRSAIVPRHRPLVGGITDVDLLSEQADPLLADASSSPPASGASL
jgi:hypothetical protein